MGRPPLHPATQLFCTQLAARLLVLAGVASLPACSQATAAGGTAGGSASHGTGGTTTTTHPQGTGGTGGTSASTTAGGSLPEGGLYDGGLAGPPPPGPACLDLPTDAGDCPTDPDAIIFALDTEACLDAGGGLDVEPFVVDSGPTRNAENQCCYVVEFQFCINGGRPYLVAEQPRVAGPRREHRWTGAERASSPDLAGLTADERSALAGAWTAEALLEHASVASFARFSLALLAAGAPAGLVEAAHHAALDEVRHAELCFALASAYAGESVGPGPFPVGERVEVSASLVDLAVSTVREGCVGESVAAVVAAEQLAVARDPAVRAALTRIVADEARHAELAWRTVAWALEAGGDDVHEAVTEAFRAALAARPLPATKSSRLALEAHGRLDPATTESVAAAALAGVVAPAARALLQRSERLS
jgi:hypothetical protein